MSDEATFTDCVSYNNETYDSLKEQRDALNEEVFALRKQLEDCKRLLGEQAEKTIRQSTKNLELLKQLKDEKR